MSGTMLQYLRDLKAGSDGNGGHATALISATEAQQFNETKGLEYPVSGDATTVWLWEDAMPRRVNP
jgi:hypothetical protein